MKENEDYYWDGKLMVLTAKYLLARGYCCGNGCRHCPYGEDIRNAAAGQRQIRNRGKYTRAIDRIEQLITADPETTEGQELSRLADTVLAYEAQFDPKDPS